MKETFATSRELESLQTLPGVVKTLPSGSSMRSPGRSDLSATRQKPPIMLAIVSCAASATASDAMPAVARPISAETCCGGPKSASRIITRPTPCTLVLMITRR